MLIYVIITLSPGVAYMHQYTNHHLNKYWDVVDWTLCKKFQWNLDRNSYIFSHENAFEHVVWEWRAFCLKLNVLRGALGITMIEAESKHFEEDIFNLCCRNLYNSTYDSHLVHGEFRPCKSMLMFRKFTRQWHCITLFFEICAPIVDICMCVHTNICGCVYMCSQVQAYAIYMLIIDKWSTGMYFHVAVYIVYVNISH